MMSFKSTLLTQAEAQFLGTPVSSFSVERLFHQNIVLLGISCNELPTIAWLYCLVINVNLSLCAYKLCVYACHKVILFASQAILTVILLM